MARALGRSMPARLALDLLEVGEAVVIPVLGMGVIESTGEEEDDIRVADAYAELATDSDPAAVVREFFADEVGAHLWMGDPLAPMRALFTKPTDQVQDKIRKVGRTLKDLSIRGCEEWAEVDLLGRVSIEMSHLANRRKGRPGYNISVDASALSAAIHAPETVLLGGKLTDTWAGSGMRAIGMATTMRSIGREPSEMEWELYEADPIFRMIIAINARAFDLGEKIKILDGTEYKQAILAAYTRGEAPHIATYDIPEDIMSGARDGE